MMRITSGAIHVCAVIATVCTALAPLAPTSAAAMNAVEKAALVRSHCFGVPLDPWNEYISAVASAEGRFNIGAFQPAPWDLVYAWPDDPHTSFTTIRIDGVDHIYGASYDPDGFFVQPPFEVDALTNRSIWQVGEVAILQTLRIVTGTTTGNPDTIQIQYELMNAGDVTHEVGLRLMLDTEINYNDGAPFRLPGIPNAITTELELEPPAVPQYYQAFFDLADSEHVAQGTLDGGDATPPERLVFASWPDIFNTTWDYTVTPDKIFGDEYYPDSAVALYWSPDGLPPGAMRRLTTYYGLGGISGSPDLSISGPTQLGVAGVQWSPNPFTVVAYLQNNTSLTFSGSSLTLDLSAAVGLQLAAGESASHPVPDLPAGQTLQTSWSVVAVAPGTWPYRVADAVRPLVSAERTITVPEITAECTPRAIEACGTGLPGTCSEGTRTCSTNGEWGACLPASEPVTEACGDGLDNDCDGLTDAGDPDCASHTIDCTGAVPSGSLMWPPDKALVPVMITGITGASGGEAAVTVSAITQDEPVDGNKGPDGVGIGTPVANLRADRRGNGNGGRVYVITFTATVPSGASCQGTVSVCVPHDMAHLTCVDDGQIYDSTVVPKKGRGRSR